MRPLRALIVRLVRLFRRDRYERDLVHELESHLQLHVDENIRAGMSRHEARRVALARLGGLASVTERCRAVHGVSVVHAVARDLRYARRTLRRSPGFTMWIEHLDSPRVEQSTHVLAAQAAPHPLPLLVLNRFALRLACRWGLAAARCGLDARPQ